MDLKIVLGVQSISNKFLTDLFSLITKMGEVAFFVAIFCLIYWCYNKRFALFFALNYIFVYSINSALKMVIARPRPWQANTNVINYTNSSGYSFPSGHSSSIAAVSTSLLIEKQKNKSKRWVNAIFYVLLILAAVLVAFSRIYLGQHYLTDVLVGLGIGTAVSFLTAFLFKFIKKEESFALYLLPIVFAIPFLYASEMFSTNLTNSKVFIYIGLISSVIIGYYLEKKFVRFSVKSNILFNVFKITFGVASTLALYYLLDFILPQILILEFVKAFILGFYISFGIMWFFKFFVSRLQIEYLPKQEKDDVTSVKK